jgi:hypothetical protein
MLLQIALAFARLPLSISINHLIPHNVFFPHRTTLAPIRRYKNISYFITLTSNFDSLRINKALINMYKEPNGSITHKSILALFAPV